MIQRARNAVSQSREPATTETLGPDDGSGGAAAGPLPVPGGRLGRYVLHERIGAGGMGQIYAAHDPDLDRRVALKLLRPTKSGPQYAARLQREAQALARLAHPNVINVFDVGTADGRVFIAMELVAGRTAAAWLAERQCSWREIVACFLQAGRGLAAAHAAGLVHRDFKPSNILVGDDGRVRVLDFGLAREFAVDESADGEDGTGPPPDGPPTASPEPSSTSASLSQSMTATGALLGTPAYMAPEQTLGQRSDARSDQFSFCVALWEALYGIRPFTGEDRIAVARQARREEWREPPTGTGVPKRLRRLLERGLRADPEDRYPTLEPLLAELANLVEGRFERRRLLAAALLLATIAGLAVFQLMPRSELLCQGAERKWTGVWDAPRRAAVADAFLATGTPYAEDAWRAVDERLTRIRQRWIDLSTEACEATHLRGEQSARLLDLQTACLDGGLAETRALTELFVEADTDLVRGAVRAVSRLGQFEPCTDLESLGGQVPLPDPEHRAELDDLQGELARARSFFMVGRYEDGQELIARIAPRMRELEYAPLNAEHLYWSGVFRESLGDLKGAVDDLLAAASAAEAGRSDESRARILLRLTWLVGVHLADYEQAHRFGRLTAATLERLGAAGDLLEAKLEHVWGGLFNSQGRGEEAIEHLQAALAGYERWLGPEHLDVAVVRMSLGISLAILNRFEEAEDSFREALRVAEAAYGPRHPYVSTVLYNLGNAFYRLRRFNDARQALERSRDILEGLGGSSERFDLVKTLDMLGATLVQAGRAADALPLLLEARQGFEDIFGTEHPALAPLYAHLAAAHLALGEPGQARELAECGAELSSEIRGDPFSRNGILFVLARVLDAEGERERARTLAEEIRRTSLESGSRPDLLLEAEVAAWLAKGDGR